MNEKKYLEEYDISKYERPSVAADMAVFTVVDRKQDNPKKSPEKKLSVMLIKRGEHPFKGKWALPGGFLKMDETIEQCAFRELSEETGLEKLYLKQFRTYSTVDRDPRGRIISCAYISLINNSSEIVRASSDAADAAWFDIAVTETENGFSYILSNDGNVLLSADIAEKNDEAVIEKTEGELAFDHVRIITDAVHCIRTGIDTSEYIFMLLPEKFSIPQMQQVYALVKGRSVSKEVVHRLYDKKIEKTMASETEGQHKRAVLYRKK
ncbi:MAG: NUDIX domain-containing protein [Oscillospiraceae bacterium]|nr:NUDIX domain-containing protein [Oscillospiraceae bacterium]